MNEIAKEFKITCAIENEHCYERIEKGVTKRFVVGRASGTKIDREEERIAASAVASFQKAIEEGIFLPDGTYTLVPLQSEHKDGWDDTLGWLTRAWIDEENDLYIEAELDMDNPRSLYLYRELKKEDKLGRPRKMLGLSIGGRVIEASEEWDEGLQKFIRTYHKVALREVSVTSRPAYPTAFLDVMNKSIKWDRVTDHRFVWEDTMEQQEKINENVEKNDEAQAMESVEDAAQVAKADEATAEVAEEAVEKAEEVAEDAAESVEKEEHIAEESEDAVEKASTSVRISTETWADAWDGDPMGALKAAVESLMNEIEEMKGVLKSVTEAQSEPAVEKSEEVAETEGEPVEKTEATAESAEAEIEKSSAEDEGALLVKALTDTLRETLDDKLSPVMSQIEALGKRIEVVENTEVDKSITVSEALDNLPEEPTHDPVESFLESTRDLAPEARLSEALKVFGGNLYKR